MNESKEAANKQLLLALHAAGPGSAKIIREARKAVIAGILAEDPSLIKWLQSIVKVYS